MNIKNIGHSMKYEAECIAMLFFPDEKIVTTEYPADEEEHEELLVQQEQKEQKAPVEDCIETRLQNGLMKVTLSLDGKQTSLCRTILSEPHSPYEKAEFVMSDMIYTLLSQATGMGNGDRRSSGQAVPPQAGRRQNTADGGTGI